MSRTPDDPDFRFGITRDQLEFLVRFGFAHGCGTVEGPTGSGVLDCQESAKLIVDTWIETFKARRADGAATLAAIGSTPPIDLAALARGLDAIERADGAMRDDGQYSTSIRAGTDHIRALAGMPTKGPL